MGKKRDDDYDDHDVAGMLIELLETAIEETPDAPDIHIQGSLKEEGYLTEDVGFQLKIGRQTFLVTVQEHTR